MSEQTENVIPSPKLHLLISPLNNDIYLASLNLPETKSKPTRKINLTFIADCSASMGNSFRDLLVPSMKGLFGSIKPDLCECFLFGSGVTKVEIKTLEDFAIVEKKDLEGATNIEIGIVNAVSSSIESWNKSTKDSTQIFCFLSDGGHNSTPVANLEKSIEECGLKVKEANLFNLFLVVGIGSSSDTTQGMKAKKAIQSVDNHNQYPIHYAKSHADLTKTMEDLTKEQELSLGASVINIHCKPENQILMKNLISNATNQISTLTLDQKVLFAIKGNFDEKEISVIVDNVEYSVYVEREKYNESSHVLDIVHNSIQEVALMGVTQENSETVKNHVTYLSNIVSNVKGRDYIRNVKSAEERIKMMRTLRLGVMDLQHNLNILKDKLIIIGVASNEEKANFLRNVAEMRYGAKALRRAVHADADKIFKDALRFSNYEFKKEELEADRVSILSTETESSHYNSISQWASGNSEAQEKEIVIPTLEVLEMLYGYGAIGYFIRVSRSSGSEIDPWALKILYVSSDLGDTSSAVCAMQAQYTMLDLVAKEVVEDILVVINPKNPQPGKVWLKSALSQTYHSLIFTRNLNLAMPREQRNSLLMQSLVRTISQLYESENLRTLKHMNIVTDIIFTLHTVCHWDSEWWVERNANLLKPNPGMYFTQTERDNVKSLSQIVALLLVNSQSFITSKAEANIEQWKKVRFSLIREAAAREMKYYLKSKQAEETKHAECQYLLGITQESCLKPLGVDEEEPLFNEESHSNEFDFTKSTKASDLFDYKSITDMMRVSSFIEIWQNLFFGSGLLINNLATNPDKEIETLHEKLRAEVIILVQQEKVDLLSPKVKVSTIIQGLLNPASKDRKDGLPDINTDELAEDFLKNMARQIRISAYQTELAKKAKILAEREATRRQQMKEEDARIEQEEFLKIHKGNALCFNIKEIKEMNKTRPLADQLDITNSGMLLHHCGYPACPLYLVNQATREDLALGTNYGLWKHLSGFVYPKNAIVTGFHVICKNVFNFTYPRPKTLEEFTKKCLDQMQFQIKSKNLDMDELLENIKEVWDTYKRWENEVINK